MPIMVKAKGSLAEGSVQTSYVIVATGISERDPTGGAGRPGAHGDDGDREPAAPGAHDPAAAGREEPDAPGGQPATQPVGAEDAQGLISKTDFSEDNILPGDDKQVRADVHLVWATGGVALSQQPAGTTLQSDAASGLTRLTFPKALLSVSSWSMLTAVWGSETFGLECVPGEGDQLVTGYLCRPGQAPADAVASHAIYLNCSRERLSLLGRMLRWLFG